MANSDSNKRFWLWLIIGLIAAAILTGTLLYIGWFDTNTHVDSNNGDDVLQQYELTGQNAQSPGEADWQNADGESFMQEVTDPAVTPQTPPTGE